jgi:hypothetical protein
MNMKKRKGCLYAWIEELDLIIACLCAIPIENAIMLRATSAQDLSALGVGHLQS